MGKEFNFEAKGLEELWKKLETLGKKEANKILRKSMRESMKPVKSEAQQTAPVDSGRTKAAVRLKAAKTKGRNPAIEVGVGEVDYQGVTYYASFLLFGWTTKNGKKIPGRNWLKDAFDKTKDAALKDCVQKTWAGIKEFTKFRLF